MKKNERAAKVTPANKEEAKRLRLLWESRKANRTQAEFGEEFGIGNQSAVGQFLRGEIPLSLKAARGFATGLGCELSEFSPRLAAEAAEIAKAAPVPGLSKAALEIAREIDGFTGDTQAWVLEVCRDTIAFAKRRVVDSARVNQQPESSQRRAK